MSGYIGATNARSKNDRRTNMCFVILHQISPLYLSCHATRHRMVHQVCNMVDDHREAAERFVNEGQDVAET